MNLIGKQECDIIGVMENLESKKETLTEQNERETAELGERLKSLIDKKVVGFEVNMFGADILIRFDDGTILEFTSLDAYNDAPYPEGVEVHIPEKQPNKPE